MLLAPAMLLIFVAGEQSVSIFGSAYAAHGTHLLWILAVAAIPDAITNIYAPVLRVRHRLRAAAVMTMAMAVGTIIGAWILAPTLKLTGVGAVWLTGQALGSLWVAWDTRAIARVLHLAVWPRRRGRDGDAGSRGSLADTHTHARTSSFESISRSNESAEAKLRSAASRDERRRALQRGLPRTQRTGSHTTRWFVRQTIRMRVRPR